MKKLTFAILISLAITSNLKAKQQWEYACFQYKQGVACIWKTPAGIIDGKHINEFYDKLKIKTTGMPFPPSFEMLNYAGQQGWELVSVLSEDVSETGMFMYWFKRPKIVTTRIIDAGEFRTFRPAFIDPEALASNQYFDVGEAKIVRPAAFSEKALRLGLGQYAITGSSIEKHPKDSNNQIQTKRNRMPADIGEFHKMKKEKGK